MAGTRCLGCNTLTYRPRPTFKDLEVANKMGFPVQRVPGLFCDGCWDLLPFRDRRMTLTSPGQEALVWTYRGKDLERRRQARRAQIPFPL